MAQHFPLPLPQFVYAASCSDENKMVDPCEFMILLLINHHVAKLWQSCENNCGTGLEHKFPTITLIHTRN